MKMDDQPQEVAYVKILNGKYTDLIWAIRDEHFSIGRASSNHISIPYDKHISKYHCAIHKREDALYLEDLQSVNGTYLSGKRLQGTAEITIPACVAIGHTRLAILPAGAGSREVASLEELSFSAEGSIIVPTGMFSKERTEAFFVVDLVNSSHIAQENEVHLSKIISVMGHILDRTMRGEKHAFLKCTGDGFFACFETPRTALDTASKLMPRLLHVIGIPLKASFALHWGTGRMTAGGDRTGKDVYIAFAVENLRRAVPEMKEEVKSSDRPEYIVMTQTFHSLLESSLQEQARPLGEYPLKGLDHKERVLLWTGARDAM